MAGFDGAVRGKGSIIVSDRYGKNCPAFRNMCGPAAAIMKRAERLDLISATAYKSFNIRLRKDGMHKAEPGKWSGDETTHRFRRLVHRAAAQELITRSKASGLLGISLREFDAEFAETAMSA